MTVRSQKLIFLVGFLLVNGCASISPTQVGQTTGAIAGAAIIPGIGMPIGVLVGHLAGLVVEKEVDKKREQKERIDLAKQLEESPADSPRTEYEPQAESEGAPARVWVDEHVSEGRLVAGHFEERNIP